MSDRTMNTSSTWGQRARAVTRWLARTSIRRIMGMTLKLSLLLAAAAFFVGPFYWLFLTAVKPKDQLFTIPLVWWPREFVWQNFYTLWFTKAPFGRYLTNTVKITGINIIGQTLSASIVAYGFARGRFWGKDAWFVVLLSTMMIPAQVTLIPLFVIFRNLGWLDSLYPLTVPGFFGGGAYFIFLLRQFFLTLPIELEEAARVDGATTMRILLTIYLPLSVPALTAVAVFAFMNHWNDFFGPLLYLNRRDNWTLTLGLAALQDPQIVDYNERMAGAFLVSLPCLVVFFMAQRFFTEGVVMSGLKG